MKIGACADQSVTIYTCIGPFAFPVECHASFAMTKVCGPSDVRASHPLNWVLRMPPAHTRSHARTHTRACARTHTRAHSFSVLRSWFRLSTFKYVPSSSVNQIRNIQIANKVHYNVYDVFCSQFSYQLPRF